MLITETEDAQTLRPRGSNQSGLGEFNERVLLQVIRLHGSQPKAELARLTGLSSQTVSLIVNRLLEQGLVRKCEAIRGKVGQPSVPITLDPDGAFAIGVKVGRRSLDLLLVDFLGEVRERLSTPYAYPDPERVFEDIRTGLAELRRRLGRMRAPRLCGVGIAAPLVLGGWQELTGMPPALAAAWQGVDIRERVQARTSLPVHFAKDTSAACVAELVSGHGRRLDSFLYVFIDTFIGGGLVLDSQLRAGPHGNAGAIGSLAMRLPGQGAVPQLLAGASLYRLEQAYAAAGLDVAAVADTRALEAPWRSHTEAWVGEAAAGIAFAIHNACCVVDLEHVVLDGALAPELRALLVSATETALQALPWEGIAAPGILAGSIGADARALGGAMLPLYAHFAPASGNLLKA